MGAVVSREVEEAEYDPLNPAVGAVASTVRVTERPRRPASQQPRPTLLLKAMRDAQRSTVASVRPFLVRPQETAKQQRNANKVGGGGTCWGLTLFSCGFYVYSDWLCP